MCETVCCERSCVYEYNPWAVAFWRMNLNPWGLYFRDAVVFSAHKKNLKDHVLCPHREFDVFDNAISKAQVSLDISAVPLGCCLVRGQRSEDSLG